MVFINSGYTKGIMLHEDVSFLIYSRCLNIYETFYTCCLRMFAFSSKTALSYFIFQMICNAKMRLSLAHNCKKCFTSFDVEDAPHVVEMKKLLLR